MKTDPPFDNGFVRVLQIHGRGQAADELARALRLCIEAVTRTGKAAGLSVKVSVTPAAQGAYAIDFAPVSVKLPAGERPKSLWFGDENFNLHRGDPRQAELSLQTIEHPTNPQPLPDRRPNKMAYLGDQSKSTPMNDPEIINNTKTLLDAGKALGGVVKDHNGVPFVIVPKGYELKDLAHLLPPERVIQKPVFYNEESFCAYVKRFKEPPSVIFVDLQDGGCAIEAILDYHIPGSNMMTVGAACCSHRASLVLQLSAGWKRWMAANKVKMDQVAFASFLEENSDLLHSPKGAELLELVLALEAKSAARYNSAVKLQNGAVKFTYEEDVELRGNTSVTNGAVELPTELAVLLSPFEGQQPAAFLARLRYQLANRKVVFWYETMRPEQMLRERAKSAVEAIAQATGVTVLQGRVA